MLYDYHEGKLGKASFYHTDHNPVQEMVNHKNASLIELLCYSLKCSIQHFNKQTGTVRWRRSHSCGIKQNDTIY